MKLTENVRQIVLIQERQQLQVTKSHATIKGLLIVWNAGSSGSGKKYLNSSLVSLRRRIRKNEHDAEPMSGSKIQAPAGNVLSVD